MIVKKPLIKILFTAIILFGSSLETSFNINVFFGYFVKIFSMFVLLLSSFYFVYKIIILKKPPVLKILVLLYIYTLFNCFRDFDNFPIFGVNILINFGSCFFVYYFSRQNRLSFDDLKYLFSKYAYVSLTVFFLTYYLIGFETVNNSLLTGPSFIIMPLFIYIIYFFWHQPKKMLWYYLIILSITAFAGKRTVFLAGLLGLLIYFYYYRKSYSKMVLKKIISAFLISSIILLGSIYLYSTNPLFKYRVEQSLTPSEDSRSLLYGNLILEYLSFDSNQRIYGIGFNGVKSFTIGKFENIHAHNDFLELLIDTGIIGVSLYILFLLFFLKFILLKKHNRIHKSVLVFMFMSWLILSFTQSNIYAPTSIMYFILLGFILGTDRHKLQIN